MALIAVTRGPHLPQLDASQTKHRQEAQDELGQALTLALPNLVIAGQVVQDKLIQAV